MELRKRWSLARRLIAATSMVCFLAGCKTAKPSEDRRHDYIRQTSSVLLELWSDEPNLAGFAGVEEIARNAYSGRSEEDQVLISGRLYEGLLRALNDQVRSEIPYRGSSRGRLLPPSRANVRETFSRPIDVAAASRERFDQMLANLKERSADDPELMQRLALSHHFWTDEGFTCLVDGIQVSTFVCVTILNHAARPPEFQPWDYAFIP